MAKAYLALGSNLGDRDQNIKSALQLLEDRGDIRVSRVSSLYETKPVGLTDQPDFINAVAEVETELTPQELLEAALASEHHLGRVRTIRWGPRVIDIDILLYDNISVNEPGLVIPHPKMMNRQFVLTPLAEIAPELILPNGKTASEAARGAIASPDEGGG